MMRASFSRFLTRGCFFVPLFFLVFLLSACNGTNDGNNSLFAKATIGPEGGTITSPDGMLTLEVPAQALASPTEISS